MIPLALALALGLQDIEIRLTAAAPRFRGSMTFDEQDADGNRFTVKPGVEAVPAIEVALVDGSNRFYLEARRLALSGRQTLDEPRRWNETLFPAGDTVDMRFDWDRIRLGVETGGAVEEGAYFFLVGGLRYDILRFVLDSDSQGEDDDTIGVVSVDYGLKFLGTMAPTAKIEMELRGIQSNLLEDTLNGFSGALRVRWEPARGLALMVGYEAESLWVEKVTHAENNRLSYDAGGPVAGLVLTF